MMQEFRVFNVNGLKLWTFVFLGKYKLAPLGLILFKDE
jgi:hypothetical protein